MRTEFKSALHALEARIQDSGAIVIQAIRGAIVAIEDWDAGVLDYLTDLDARIDETYLAVERDVEVLLARQAPVAGDLRAVLANLHANIHLERMSHNCVRLARLAAPSAEGGLPKELGGHFERGLGRGAEMTRIALDALVLRDLERAESLPQLDELVDRETADVVLAVLDEGASRYGQEPSVRTLFAARCVERIADHAVKIGEQAAFLVTGEFRDFANGAHPPEL
jgi:phosphate transport system protein